MPPPLRVFSDYETSLAPLPRFIPFTLNAYNTKYLQKLTDTFFVNYTNYNIHSKTEVVFTIIEQHLEEYLEFIAY